MRWVAALALLASAPALAEVTYESTPRAANLEIKLGGFKPLIDSEKALTGTPYSDVFGSGSMLLFEIEADRYLWQKYGTAGIGLSVGYAEKYGSALSSVATDEKTNFKVVPLRLLGLYRLDYWALHFGVPLVPYAKAGFVYTPWWSGKGSSAIEYVGGQRAAGGKWGYELVGGLSLMLDFFEPKLAHDFRSDLGVQHTYLFAEFTYANVDNFGASGLVLSSRHFMFGLSFEY